MVSKNTRCFHLKLFENSINSKSYVETLNIKIELATSINGRRFDKVDLNGISNEELEITLKSCYKTYSNTQLLKKNFEDHLIVIVIIYLKRK